MPVPSTRCIQMHTPSPRWVCRILFLTGASNNHNDSFPFFLSLSSFCALHRFRRARSALSCYLPLFVPFPLPSFFTTISMRGGGCVSPAIRALAAGQSYTKTAGGDGGW